MPAAIAIPAIMSAAGTAATVYGANKAAKAAKLDPTTQAYQNEALKMQNERMKMLNPLYQQLVTAASNRLPSSMGGGGMQAPSIGQMRSPGMGQALSQMSRAMPAPQRGPGRNRIIWGD